jgi:hypothetical protein
MYELLTGRSTRRTARTERIERRWSGGEGVGSLRDMHAAWGFIAGGGSELPQLLEYIRWPDSEVAKME